MAGQAERRNDGAQADRIALGVPAQVRRRGRRRTATTRQVGSTRPHHARSRRREGFRSSALLPRRLRALHARRHDQTVDVPQRQARTRRRARATPSRDQLDGCDEAVTRDVAGVENARAPTARGSAHASQNVLLQRDRWCASNSNEAAIPRWPDRPHEASDDTHSTDLHELLRRRLPVPASRPTLPVRVRHPRLLLACVQACGSRTVPRGSSSDLVRPAP